MSFLKYLNEADYVATADTALNIPFKTDQENTENRFPPNLKPKSDCDGEKTREEELDEILQRLKDLILNKQSMENEEPQQPADGNDASSPAPDEGQDMEMGGPEPVGFGDDFDPEEDTGVIRVVKNAHLVYKRKMPDGLYEELWIYNIGSDTANDEYKIRREILRGTDIEPHEKQSKDGSQHYRLWTVGNGQMLHILGLPN